MYSPAAAARAAALNDNTWSVSPGTIDPEIAFQQAQAQGESQFLPQSDGPDRSIYELTDEFTAEDDGIGLAPVAPIAAPWIEAPAGKSAAPAAPAEQQWKN
jgi:hypothetical protein